MKKTGSKPEEFTWKRIRYVWNAPHQLWELSKLRAARHAGGAVYAKEFMRALVAGRLDRVE